MPISISTPIGSELDAPALRTLEASAQASYRHELGMLVHYSAQLSLIHACDQELAAARVLEAAE